MRVLVISATCQEFAGERFYRCGPYFQRKGRRLHRVVWEAAHGAVPRGHHVHHVDHDRANNQLANLALHTAKAHLSAHMREPARVAQSRRTVRTAIAAAPAWHASAAGQAWHVQHAQALTGVHTERTVDKLCEHCGKPFAVAPLRRTSARFCGNNCKSAWRRAQGLDVVSRTCAVCGVTFSVNRYWTNRTCGLVCGGKLAHTTRRSLR